MVLGCVGQAWLVRGALPIAYGLASVFLPAGPGRFLCMRRALAGRAEAAPATPASARPRRREKAPPPPPPPGLKPCTPGLSTAHRAR